MITQAIEVKKVSCRQDKDGNWLVTIAVHPNDHASELVLAHPGTVFDLAYKIESAVDRLLRAEEGGAPLAPATADEEKP